MTAGTEGWFEQDEVFHLRVLGTQVAPVLRQWLKLIPDVVENYGGEVEVEDQKQRPEATYQMVCGRWSQAAWEVKNVLEAVALSPA